MEIRILDHPLYRLKHPVPGKWVAFISSSSNGLGDIKTVHSGRLSYDTVQSGRKIPDYTALKTKRPQCEADLLCNLI
jgi:hypothetical protein